MCQACVVPALGTYWRVKADTLPALLEFRVCMEREINKIITDHCKNYNCVPSSEGEVRGAVRTCSRVGVGAVSPEEAAVDLGTEDGLRIKHLTQLQGAHFYCSYEA